jgi:putative ABC transport system permease protein
MKKGIHISLRSIWKQKEFSFLNVIGLGVGIGGALLIFLLIRNELSIDQFWPKKDRIYRVISSETYRNGLKDYDGCAPIPLGDALRNEFPQAEQVASTYRSWKSFLVVSQVGSREGSNGAPDKKFRTQEIYYTEPQLFHIFDFTWLAGDPNTALKDPSSMVITRRIAETWFGKWTDALGKVVQEGDAHRPMHITGILEDYPSNTDMNMDVLLPYDNVRKERPGDFSDPKNWDNFSSGCQCFFLLKQGSSIAGMNQILPGFIDRHFTPLAPHSDTQDSCSFQPLSQMHFDQRYSHYGGDGWSYTELWSLGLIGAFLLLLACINFINLATAQSLNKAKEVGVRKVLGSSKSQLVVRFMSETALLVCVAMFLGCILAELSFSSLNQLLAKQIPLSAFILPSTFAFLGITGVIVIFLSGLYPGWVLSGYNPASVLKGRVNAPAGSSVFLRRALVVAQFAIAQVLIIGTLVIVKQMHFFQTRPLGFQKNDILMVYLPGISNPQLSATKMNWMLQRVKQIPGVEAASLCNEPPSTTNVSTCGFSFDTRPLEEPFELMTHYADTGYLSTYKISLAAGRLSFASDTSREIMLNETAVHKLGFKDPHDILGKNINLAYLGGRGLPIVGVFHDFNNTSLRDKILPMFILSDMGNYYQLAMRIQPDKAEDLIREVGSLYSQNYPEAPYDPQFYADRLTGFYKSEAQSSSLFKIFASLAILISCLGLYGLVSFMAVRKNKEVGIRKVLGASIQSIVLLFTREFTLLVALSFIIAAPLGYLAMHQWLNEFYYHVDMGWFIFFAALGSSVLIAWITIAYRAVKAALANPIKSLKYE